MATKLQINLVENALLALLPDRLKASYGVKVHVATIDKRDFDEDGQLVLTSPAVRVRFTSASYGKVLDTQKTNYNGELSFSILCFHESLKSKGDERTKTFQLLSVVQDELAGARLQLTPGVYTEPVQLVSVDQVIDAMGPIDQCYAANFIVPGIAQFSGVNSNFGVRP